MTDTKEIFGAEILPVQQTGDYIDWLLDNAERPLASNVSLKYAVLQCTNTCVWGILHDSVWALSSDIENAGINAPTKLRLLEARIFGADADVLIWKTADGFTGRVLQQSASAPNEVQKPLERHAAFQPSRDKKAPDGTANPNYLVTPQRFGFARRELPGGRTTITPQGTHVIVLEYLSETADGVLRIAATRFVEVK